MQDLRCLFRCLLFHQITKNYQRNKFYTHKKHHKGCDSLLDIHSAYTTEYIPQDNPPCNVDIVCNRNFIYTSQYCCRGIGFGFGLYNDTWSQQGHYDRTFLNLQITRPDITPHIKWAVSLGITYSHFNLPQGFVWICMG